MSTPTTTTTSPTSTGTYPTFPIVIRVLESRNLKIPSGRSDYTLDPYVVVSFRKGMLAQMMSTDKEGRFQSRILENTPNPVWNEEFILHPTKPGSDWIVVKVYDRDRVGKKDTLLGKVKLHIADFWNKGIVDRWFPLETTFSKTGHGEIHLLTNYNESGQMKTPMTEMGQGIGSSTGMNDPNMTNIQQSQTGYIQSSQSYPPPLSSSADDTTKSL